MQELRELPRNATTKGFDAHRFAGYLRARGRTVLISCVLAAVLAGAVSLLMPKRYTATASILIGAPAGLDPRAATNVSTVYLESLRTYEHLASSDSLFLKALDHLDLRRQYGGRSIESLKRGVLRVTKPLNTRVIEISATLEDPVKAQALAQYIADQTVALSRSLDDKVSSDVSSEANANFEAASARLKKAAGASEQFAKRSSVDGLRADLQGARDLKFQIERDLEPARAQLAESAANDPRDRLSRHIANLETQAQTLGRAISARDMQLQALSQQSDALEEELTAARKEFELEKTRKAEVLGAASFRGERLDVFDPGIVPQRPSSPNTALNAMAALLLGAVVSIGYLAFRFGYERPG